MGSSTAILWPAVLEISRTIHRTRISRRFIQAPSGIHRPLQSPRGFAGAERTLGLEFASIYNTHYYMERDDHIDQPLRSALSVGDALSAGLQFEAFVKHLTLYDASAIQAAD